MSILTSDSQSQQQLYEEATDYIKSLNSKFRDKAVITLVLNDKILRSMFNKMSC